MKAIEPGTVVPKTTVRFPDELRTVELLEASVAAMERADCRIVFSEPEPEAGIEHWSVQADHRCVGGLLAYQGPADERFVAFSRAFLIGYWAGIKSAYEEG